MQAFRKASPTTKLLLSGFACLCIVTLTIVVLSINLLRAAVEREAMGRVDSSMIAAEQALHELGPVRVLANGALFAGSVNLRSNALVDKIGTLTGGDASVFRGDTIFSTTILLGDGTRAVDTPLEVSAVRDAVLARHGPYRGVVNVLGRRYYSASDPIVDSEGLQVATLHVGMKDSAVLQGLTGTRNIIVAGSSGIVVAAGLFLSWLGSKLAAQIADRQRQLELTHSHLDTALANMANGLSLWDSSNRLVLANRRLPEILGLAPERIYPGMSFREFVTARFEIASLGAGDCASAYEARLEKIVARQPTVFVDTGTNGRTIHVQFRPVADGGWITTYEDVTERQLAEAKVAFMAEHDGLTGLANRFVFQEQLHRLVAQGTPFALLLLDLDFFKKVNDKLGHAAGDTLLRATALRLQGATRENDLLARLGGDEFAIIQAGGAEAEHAAALAVRIIDILRQPFDIDGNEVCVGASCGIAFPSPSTPNMELLLKQADVALYAAKSAGRCMYRCFDQSMHAHLRERELFEEDLRQALANEEFSLFYQPLVDVRRRHVSSFEALLRWRHPARGTVSPAEFIPVAEATGLIGKVGAWVLHRACLDAATWPDHVRVAVNLSALQFHDGDLAAEVCRALHQSGLAPNRLELEITETVLLEDTSKISEILHTMRNTGVRIAMDDFGTGYCSLSYLQSFPFDKIKIDQSFVRGLNDGTGSRAIVRAVTALANSLGMETVAEGVETMTQYDQVCADGCGEVQGYLFSRPRPANEVGAMLTAVDDYFHAEVKRHDYRCVREAIHAA